MAQPEVGDSIGAPKPDPKPGDGSGPTRLHSSLQAGRERGAYKCKDCGQKHGGDSCGRTGAGSRASRAGPAPVPPAPIFTPENTGRLLRAPFTIAAVRTNCRIFLLTPAEEAELCATAVPCANEWISLDPKWAALFMFLFSLSSVAISKSMYYAAWRRQMSAELEKESKAKNAPTDGGSGGSHGATPTPASPLVS